MAKEQTRSGIENGLLLSQKEEGELAERVKKAVVLVQENLKGPNLNQISQKWAEKGIAGWAKYLRGLYGSYLSGAPVNVLMAAHATLAGENAITTAEPWRHELIEGKGIKDLPGFVGLSYIIYIRARTERIKEGLRLRGIEYNPSFAHGALPLFMMNRNGDSACVMLTGESPIGSSQIEASDRILIARSDTTSNVTSMALSWRSFYNPKLDIAASVDLLERYFALSSQKAPL